MIEAIVICALAAWTVTYGLVFSVLLEPFRKAIGIHYDLDEHGQFADRWGENKLAELLNCVYCTGFWVSVAMALLWLAGLEVVVEVLAVAGALLLVARWWCCQQSGKEWWT